MQTVCVPDFDFVSLRVTAETPLTDEMFYQICDANPDLRIEASADGGINILPPAGVESDHASVDLVTELNIWARRNKTGLVHGPSAGFSLPDGSKLSPDAAWTSDERLQSVPREELRRFPNLCPNFVVEVMSPSDRLAPMKRKMRQWIDNGAELGWLVEPDREMVYVYRPGQEPEALRSPGVVQGEGPIEGFEFDFNEIWS